MARSPEFDHAFALWEAGQAQEALVLFRQLAEAKDPDALFTMADFFWRGAPGVPMDNFRARRIFEVASAVGHAMGRNAVTNMAASGCAGLRDWEQAVARLRVEAQDDPRRAHMLWLIDQMALTPEGDPAQLPQGELLSEAPHVTLYRGAFTQAECDYLVIVAEPSFEPSEVVATDGSSIRDPIRNSDGGTFHWLIEDPATHALSRRLAAISGTHVSQAEPMQILRYRPGQEYKRHLDYQPGAENQRILTALVYLNEAYTGGETFFVKVGMQVRGHFGDCIVFRNTIDGERADPMSEHAGLPVTAGTKLLASRWIRARPRAPVRGAAQALFN